MSGFLNFVKTIFIPATISLALYLAFTFAIIPVYRRSRQRYAQYLPLNAISSHTSSLRERVSETLMNFLLPITWRRRAFGQPTESHYARESEESLFDEEEGEGMVGFNVDASRRDAIARREEAAITERRLSRDLEEGFRDDSDDSDDEARRDGRDPVQR